MLASAHDIAEGGLATAIAECCLAGGIGADLELGALLGALASGAGEQALLDGLPAAVTAALFGEAPGGFVVSGREGALAELAAGAGAEVRTITLGRVGGDSLRLRMRGSSRSGDATGGGDRELVSLALAELEEAHGALRELFP